MEEPTAAEEGIGGAGDSDPPGVLGEADDVQNRMWLGFDFSTQQVKAVAVDDSGNVVAEESVHFDNDLPEYRTQGGAHIKGCRATSPTIMWVKALDILMEKLRICGVDFADVAGISGCGQQHGTVFWRAGAAAMLSEASEDKFLHDELAHAFAVLDSPIWMDSSTTDECRRMEERVGGPQAFADITGSRAFERFSGPQIAKIFRERAEAYANTARISLVSSFACSLFLGSVAPIDWADGSGMALLDVRRKRWATECLDAVAPDLAERLGDPVPAATALGPVSRYMRDRFGFSEACRVVAFTGDNPASVAGLRMRAGDVGISLGTSDVVFVWLEDDGDDGDDGAAGGRGIKPDGGGGGCVWVNPVDKDAYMALLCYKNGSLTRERICRVAAEESWDIFSQLLDSTPRGNFGNIGFYFDHPEIVPCGVKGDFRFSKSGERVARFASMEAEVRALIEGQIMAKRVHADRLGMDIGPDSRILVCGGASVNKAILQVIADVFNAPVFTPEFGANAAALGSALRVKDVIAGESRTSSPSSSLKPVCTPHKDAASVYKPLMERYMALEERIVESAQSPN